MPLVHSRLSTVVVHRECWPHFNCPAPLAHKQELGQAGHVTLLLLEVLVLMQAVAECVSLFLS